MEKSSQLEEKLRESCCIGDEECLRNLIARGVDINSQNSMNGWTGLHWAAKRGHKTVVKFLLANGANPDLKTNNGEIAADLASGPEVCSLLGATYSAKEVSTSFVPNYLANPPFPYVNSQESGYRVQGMASQDSTSLTETSQQQNHTTAADELVLKARVANSAEKDFIEIEMDKTRLSYENLMTVLCGELQVNRTLVQKIRKLPNTIIRKDKDVQRLHDFQEVEIVMSNKAMSESSRNYTSSVATRHVDVVY